MGTNHCPLSKSDECCFRGGAGRASTGTDCEERDLRVREKLRSRIRCNF